MTIVTVAASRPAKLGGRSIERQVDHRLVVEETVRHVGGTSTESFLVNREVLASRVVSTPLPEWEARGLVAMMNEGSVAQAVMDAIEYTPAESREDAGFPITI